MNSDLRLVYITTESKEEARKIGRAIVKERLAACVNIIDGMESIYHWEGEIVEAAECILIAKTNAFLMSALTTLVRELHSYECPCITSLSINSDEGNADYLAWIGKEVLSKP